MNGLKECGRGKAGVHDSADKSVPNSPRKNPRVIIPQVKSYKSRGYPLFAADDLLIIIQREGQSDGCQ